MSEAYRRVTALLKGVRPHANGRSGCEAMCPAHPDRRQSLGVSLSEDGSHVLVCCQAGCTPQDVVRALGLTMRDLFERPEPPDPARPLIVDTYDYRDEAGLLLYQVVRLEPKSFRQRRRDSEGKWVWSLGNVRRVLYRLPELLRADPAAPVYVVEGEKDVEALRRLGLVSTCNSGGAGKWHESYATSLRGRDVVILPDADEPGRRHAEAVRQALAGQARSVRVVELPLAAGRKDVSDWLRDGGTAAELAQLAGGGGLPATVEDEAELVAVPEGEPARFPVEVFPAALADFCGQVAASKDAPADLPGVFMLGVAAAAIGASRAIAIKADWWECPRLYLAAIAGPGMAKTPCLNAVAAPLYRRQNRLKHTYQQEQRAWEVEGAGEAPAFTHVYTTNATTEKLADMLVDSPRGLVLVKDELASWATGMNQYKAGGKGDDREFWLSAWSGAPIKVDRKNQQAGPVLVPHPFVNVVGGIQPDRLAQLTEERERADGFVDRILFSYPAQRVSRWSRVEIGPDAAAAWSAAVEYLYGLGMDAGEDFASRPRAVAVAGAAYLAWEAWVGRHEGQMGGADFPRQMESVWAKMRSHFLRLALVLHLLRAACGEADPDALDTDTMARAESLIEYFKEHCWRSWGRLGASQADVRATRLYEWVVSHGGKTTPRDLVRHRITGLTKMSDAEKLLEDLADRGLGRLGQHRATNGKTVTVFTAAVGSVGAPATASAPGADAVLVDGATT